MDLFNDIFASPWGALIIFALRAVDVSMMTVRTIMAVRGRRLPAAVIGFFQMLFWLLAVGGALQHLDSVYHVLAYAGGFATGNYLGVWLEQHLAIGTSIVRAVFPRQHKKERSLHAVKRLREQEFAVTAVPGHGWHGEVDVLNVVVPRKRVREVIDTVADNDPEAVISVEDIQATHGTFPQGSAPRKAQRTGWLRRAA